jgi:hypothetical protein
MFRYRLGLAVALVCAFLLSCEDEAQTDSNIRGTSSQNVGDAATTPATKTIYSILEQITGTCTKGTNAHPLCKEVTVGFEPKVATEKSAGKRILIIDDGMERAAFGRYKSRVMRYLSFSDDGVLEDTAKVKPFYAGAFQVYDLLDRLYPEVRPIDLRSIKPLFREKFGQAIRADDLKNSILHGQIIFAKLAELNPSSEFWIIDDLTVAKKGWDLFCSADAKGIGIDFFKTMFKRQVTEIATLIEANKISFANFSFSDSLDAWRGRADWCLSNFGYRPSEEVVKAYFDARLEHFFRPLYSLPNFVVVQAIANGVDFTKQSVKDNWNVDCTKFPNALKVAGTKVLAPVSPEGVDASHFSSSINLNSVACADVVVNLGATLFDESEDEPIILFSNDGIQSARIADPSSSHSAPVALSYLIYLKQNCPNCSPEELLNRTRRNKPILIDPIRNRQFDVHLNDDSSSSTLDTVCLR